MFCPQCGRPLPTDSPPGPCSDCAAPNPVPAQIPAPPPVSALPEAIPISPLPAEIQIEPAVAAEIYLSPGPPPPRVYTAIAVGCLAIPISAFVATIALVAVALVLGQINSSFTAEKFEAWLTGFAATALGIAVIILPSQLSFLSVAIAAALLSPVKFFERVALRRGRLPLWSIPLLMAGTLIAGIAGGMLSMLMGGESSKQMQMMASLARAPLLESLFLIALLPAFCEEMLYRGYVQSRLLQRWRPLNAILFASFLFALAHLDPAQSLGVFPLGIWFGIVAWRAGSIWPAMFCHAANNTFFVVHNHFAEHSSEELETTPEALIVYALCFVAFLISIPVLVIYGRDKPSTAISKVSSF